MRYVEEIMMDAIKVRSVCVDHQWYTAGDNRAYDNMFKMVYGLEYSVEGLQKIAEDIVNHTPEDHEDFKYQEDYAHCVAYVMFILRNECCKSVFFGEED